MYTFLILEKIIYNYLRIYKKEGLNMGIQTDITKSIDKYTIQRLFNNIQTRKELATSLIEENKDLLPKKITDKVATDYIIKNWNYKKVAKWTRKEFEKSSKNIEQVEAQHDFMAEMNEWLEKYDDDLKWVISQGNFDAFIQYINNVYNGTEEERDELVSKAAIKMRRIKSINTKRNDAIEQLIVKHDCTIMPTLKHINHVDFYINGIAYDQKVSRSLGRNFEKEYGDDYLTIAQQNPELVAKSLYENQDEGRFGADSRLYVVYLNPEATMLNIKDALTEVDFQKPYPITFEYKHKNGLIKKYQTKAFVIFIN